MTDRTADRSESTAPPMAQGRRFAVTLQAPPGERMQAAYHPLLTLAAEQGRTVTSLPVVDATTADGAAAQEPGTSEVD